MKVFKEHRGPPLLVAQPQQGKTGVCIIVIDEFIKYCKQNNSTWEIIYLINISDNVLKNQTDQRIFDSGLSCYVKILHHSDLKNYTPKKVDVRLLIMDECHVALEKSSNDKIKPLHEFLKNCGIEYGQDINTWVNKDNYVLSVSATPFAHIIKSKIDSKAFEPVVLSVNDNYYRLQDMNEAKRFFQSESVVKNKKVTDFFKSRFDEFIQSCKNNGNGFLIVRAVGGAPEIIETYIKENYGEIIDIRVFDSKIKNITLLDGFLGKKDFTAKPAVAIIRGSLRAGKTLKTTKYIRMWIEPSNSKTDSMCQVVGRCLGFPSEDGSSKFDDSFPVYCNIKELDQAIRFYDEQNRVPDDDQNTVPTGIRNETNVQKEKWQQFIKKESDIPLEHLNSQHENSKGELVDDIKKHSDGSLAQSILSRNKWSDKNGSTIIDSLVAKARRQAGQIVYIDDVRIEYDNRYMEIYDDDKLDKEGKKGEIKKLDNLLEDFNNKLIPTFGEDCVGKCIYYIKNNKEVIISSKDLIHDSAMIK